MRSWSAREQLEPDTAHRPRGHTTLSHRDQLERELTQATMAKSKNHTAHNQNRKDHRGGIKKPHKHKYTSRKGVRAARNRRRGACAWACLLCACCLRGVLHRSKH